MLIWLWQAARCWGNAGSDMPNVHASWCCGMVQASRHKPARIVRAHSLTDMQLQHANLLCVRAQAAVKLLHDV